MEAVFLVSKKFETKLKTAKIF